MITVFGGRRWDRLNFLRKIYKNKKIINYTIFITANATLIQYKNLSNFNNYSFINLETQVQLTPTSKIAQKSKLKTGKLSQTPSSSMSMLITFLSGNPPDISAVV